MGKNYYLVNADYKEGNVLYVPYKGMCYRNFKDLSYFDDASIALDSDFNDEIKELNHMKDNFNGMFIAAPYRTKYGISTYPTFNISKSNLNKYEIVKEILDRFMLFIEQRQFKVEHNEKLALDINNDLRNYIIFLLDKLYSLDEYGFEGVIGRGSKVSLKLKNLLYLKTTGYNYMTPSMYYGDNYVTFNNYLSGYTELRNLTLSIIDAILGFSINHSYEIDARSEARIHGLYEEEPFILPPKKEIIKPIKVIDKKESEYHQLTLEEYFKERK